MDGDEGVEGVIGEEEGEDGGCAYACDDLEEDVEGEGGEGHLVRLAEMEGV